MHWRNGLKFDKLVYPDHFQNWLDFGHSLSISPILVQFSLSEMGQIWGLLTFSGEDTEEMAWNLAC